MRKNDSHRYPQRVRGQHDTDQLECWCAPAYMMTCNECDGHGCDTCDDEGLAPVTLYAAMETDEAVIIVHRDRKKGSGDDSLVTA